MSQALSRRLLSGVSLVAVATALASIGAASAAETFPAGNNAARTINANTDGVDVQSGATVLTDGNGNSIVVANGVTVNDPAGTAVTISNATLLGTFVNDGDRPLGNQNPHELKSGDVIRIGEYHVQVQIDSATDFSLDDSALYKRNSGSTSTRRRVPPADLGASLRLENLLEASNDISSDELKPVNAFGQAVSSRTRALMRYMTKLGVVVMISALPVRSRACEKADSSMVMISSLPSPTRISCALTPE